MQPDMEVGAVPEERRSNPALTIVAVAAVVIILGALRESAALAVPILVAALVAVVAAPYQQRLVGRGWSRLAAFALTTGATVVALIVAVAVLEAAMTSFIADLPSYAPGMEQLVRGALGLGSVVGLDLTHLVDATSAVQGLFASAGVLTQSLLTWLAEWTVVVLLVIFMLLEALDLPEKLGRLVSAPAMVRFAGFVEDLSGYLRLAAIDATFTAVADLVILVLLGAPSAVLWAGLAFLFSFVPNVGYVMIVIPPTVATFVRYGTLRAVIVFVALSVIDVFVGTVVLPRLIGKRLGISPFWGVLSLVFWAWLIGPAGAILAVPLTITVRFLLDSSPATVPLATLIEPLAREP
jgi:predicted PurR-regulated permease PerM